MSLALILAFAAIALLTLLALLWSRWPAWMKAALVFAVTALYFVGHDAVHAIWGIPSTDALPERFTLLAAVIEAPARKASASNASTSPSISLPLLPQAPSWMVIVPTSASVLLPTPNLSISSTQ